MKSLAFAAATCIACAGGAEAAALEATYSGFFVFGDSLSDPGNLFAQAGQPVSPPYFDGRFSNGPVWAEEIAGRFPLSANFAFGGAQAATNGDAIPDLAAQIGLYDASGLGAASGDRPLAALWLGANDLFAGIATNTVAQTITDATTALATGYAALRADGFEDFVLFNLPDLGQTPLYETIFPQASPGATFATEAFNAALAGLAADLSASGAKVTLIDTNALFGDLLLDPAAFGLSETDLPCLFLSGDPATAQAAAQKAGELGEPLVCSDATAQGRAFFDLVHPNAKVHAAIAANVDAALAPVPLPAGLPLLLAGLAMFGLARRRVAR